MAAHDDTAPRTGGQRRVLRTRRAQPHRPAELDLRTPGGRVLPW